MEVVDIKKKKNKQYTPLYTHPDIFQLNFATTICGARGSGKSLLIRNLLLRDDMLKKVFKKPNYIVIICPSLSNGDYSEIEGKNVYKYDHYDPNIINHLIQVQQNIIEKHSRKDANEILLILDDVLDSGALNHHSAVEKIYSRGRHVNINVILVSQQLNRVSKTMRVNSDYMIFFQTHNYNELENLMEQLIPKRYQWGFKDYIKNMWANNHYQFICVDFKTKDHNRRFREGFSKLIILEELPIKKK